MKVGVLPAVKPDVSTSPLLLKILGRGKTSKRGAGFVIMGGDKNASLMYVESGEHSTPLVHHTVENILTKATEGC